MFFIKTELKLYFNQKIWVLAACFALLALLTGLIGSGFLYEAKLFDPFDISIVNRDSSFESRVLLNNFRDSQEGSIGIYVETEEQAQARFSSGDSIGIVALPEGFIQAIENGWQTELIVTLDQSQVLNSRLTTIYIDALTKELAASQAGIYTVLNRAAGTENFQNILTEINLKYISMFLGRSHNFQEREVTATGDISGLWFYVLHIGILFLFVGTSIFMEPFNYACKNKMLMKIKLSQMSSGQFLLYKTTALFGATVPLLAIFAAVLYFAGIPFSLYLMGSLAVLLLLLAQFTLLMGLLCGGNKAAGIIVFMTALAGSFFSGGIIPLVYLPSFFEKIAVFLPHYQLYQLLKLSVLGSFSAGNMAICLVIGFVFYFLGWAYLHFVRWQA